MSNKTIAKFGGVVILFALWCVVVTSCSQASPHRRQVVNSEELSTDYNKPVIVGTIESKEIIESSGLADSIREVVTLGRPFLGICVGMQLLYEGSEEAPGVPGLGVLPGRCVKLVPMAQEGRAGSPSRPSGTPAVMDASEKRPYRN